MTERARGRGAARRVFTAVAVPLGALLVLLASQNAQQRDWLAAAMCLTAAAAVFATWLVDEHARTRAALDQHLSPDEPDGRG